MSFVLRGKTAVLTGAASGIGAATARLLASKGVNLALVDRDADGLAAIHDELNQFGVTVSVHRLDLVDAVGIATLPSAVLDVHRKVDMLLNNAGATLAGDFLELDQADFEWLMDLNFLGVVRMTRAFLPIMMSQPAAHITNISSIFGIVSVPGQTAYCASKFAVRGFSNSLRYEMKNAGEAVQILTVHPGGIKTNIARNAKPHAEMSEADAARSARSMERAFITTPESAASQIVSAIEKGWARLVIGPDAKQMMWIERFRPVRAWDVLDRIFKARARRAKAKALARQSTQ